MRLARLAFTVAVSLALGALVVGCPPKNENEDPAVARGRRAYMGTCIACHNVDPSQDGAVGPAVKGASRELLEARILHAKYPPGYQPKRNTLVMPAQPQLKDSLDDLAAFLK